jgi:elongation factor 2
MDAFALLRQQGCTDLQVSDISPKWAETIVSKSALCLAKSPNKFSRYWCTAEPLPEFMDYSMFDEQDSKKRARQLHVAYGWDITDARKIWTIGKGAIGNVLVDVTKGIQYLNEIKDAAVLGFECATKEGVLAGEPMRGIRIDMQDVMLSIDVNRRGAGQTVNAFRLDCLATCRVTLLF